MGLDSEWMSPKCAGPRIRNLPDGTVEIEGEGVVRKALPPKVRTWETLIKQKAAKYGVPPAWIAGIMALESGGKAEAGSAAGAIGLMEVLLTTGRIVAGNPHMTAEELWEPDTNVDVGTKFLRQLLEEYNWNLINTAFGYNAGKARCGRGCWRAKKGDPCTPCAPNRWGLVADCWGVDKGTLDYGTIVVRYANDAALTGFAPGSEDEVGGGDDTATTRRKSSSGGIIIAGAAALAIGFFGVKEMRKRA